MSTEYIVNPEVEEIANKVLPVVQKAWFDVPRIVYLVKVADKSRYLGKCSRATGKWAYLVNKDFVVEVFDGFWQEATQTQKEALLYHELLHITCEEDDEGEVKWGLKDHDTEEFVDVIKKYGAWNPVLEQIKTIMTAPPEIDKEVF
jgi:hypothetical protein